ncbi:hypothetical protein AB0H29_27870 [Streptomyces thermolilacinus]
MPGGTRRTAAAGGGATADEYDALDVMAAVDSTGAARIRLVGELDREPADGLTVAALACPSARPPPRRPRPADAP